jgi:hypothetical protein
MVTNRPESQDSSMYILITGEPKLPGVLCTNKFFKNKFRSTPQCIHHRGIKTPGDDYTGESRLSGGEYTRESITNRNNSLKKKKKNLKSFCLMGQEVV